MPVLPDRLGTLQRDIDALLLGAVPLATGPRGRLADAMRYAAIGSGKRFRALLTVTVAELVGASYAHAIQASAAIECVHAQSLAHDDLPCMDDDDLRRGKPSLHRQFDEATAVLAGDALLALAFELLAQEATHPDAQVRVALIAGLARTIGQDGLAGGQMMDLRPSPAPTSEEIFDCEFRKTGKLIRFAVDAGILLGRCTPAERDGLQRYADLLGIAFQIRDDLLDKVGEDDVVGKRVRKDDIMGRKTMVSLFGVDKAAARAQVLAQQCKEALAPFGGRAQILCDIADYAVTRFL